MFKLPQLLQNLIIAKMLELGVVAMIISAMYVVAAEKFEFAFDELEQQQITWTTTSIRTALHYKVLLAQVNGDREVLAKLTGVNPVLLLERPPPGYRGEFTDAGASNFPGGSWYFDKSDKSLVYLSNKGKIFTGGTSKMLKFKVKLVRISSPTAGGQSGRPEFSDLQLVQN